MVKRSLGNLLRCFVRDKPKEWENVLPIAEFAYYSSTNRTTQHSPFEIVYGMQPASVLDLSSLPLLKKEHPKATELADFIQQLHVDIKKKIEASNAKYKAQADKKKRQVIFKEGDLVWVILTKEWNPTGPNTKLQQKKIRPCLILHKINDNAYQVKLLDHLRISNSFNVHHLLPYHDQDQLTTSHTVGQVCSKEGQS